MFEVVNKCDSKLVKRLAIKLLKIFSYFFYVFSCYPIFGYTLTDQVVKNLKGTVIYLVQCFPNFFLNCPLKNLATRKKTLNKAIELLRLLLNYSTMLM